jgi:phage terminase Nu1 subunit (DNA packaging protein)
MTYVSFTGETKSLVLSPVRLWRMFPYLLLIRIDRADNKIIKKEKRMGSISHAEDDP